MENNEIKLVQSPVITHRLTEIGANVDSRIAALELDKQVATVDTVKSLKDLRAELNKELTTFEDQRKFIKKGVLSPYEEFETLYKTQISEKYTTAINLLKDKIAQVENAVKAEKQENLKRYADELCTAEKLDFLTFQNFNLDINLTVTEKKYREQINEFVTRVLDDLALIKTTEFEAEIMAEYKTTLNASKAITTVKERKEKEKAELARLKAEETQRRQSLCRKLGLSFADITQTFEYDSDIYIKNSDVENMPKDDFTKLVAEVEVKIKNKKAAELAETQTEQPQEVKTTPAPAIAAPTAEVKEEIVTASFEVTGTMAQLRSLGAFLRANAITYKNI